MLEALRVALMLGMIVAFVAVVWWAYGPSRKEEWESRGVLDEDERHDD
jgi:cbb3-type cytochrome oxidase subunit 3